MIIDYIRLGIGKFISTISDYICSLTAIIKEADIYKSIRYITTYTLRRHDNRLY